MPADAKASRVHGTEDGPQNGGREQERVHRRPAESVRRPSQFANGLQQGSVSVGTRFIRQLEAHVNYYSVMIIFSCYYDDDDDALR